MVNRCGECGRFVEGDAAFCADHAELVEAALNALLLTYWCELLVRNPAEFVRLVERVRAQAERWRDALGSQR